ncbi:MAG: hypothetical protein J1F63_06695 [Oscillospiraceae bacterium]|nr:hypothetical protein [Oscillospiraceae bacterium]
MDTYNVPFKRGDILYHHGGLWPYIDGPVVFDHMCPLELPADINDDCETADMAAMVYCQNADGELSLEAVSCYRELEYYEEELKGREKLLTALASFLQGKIGLAPLLNAYLAITLKCHSESVMSYHFSHLTDRDKELLGL